MVLCKVMDFGEIKNNKNMLEIGKIIKQMVMEFIKLKKVIIKVNLFLTQVNLLTLLNMVMEWRTFQMEIIIKVIMFKENLKAKVNIIGQMVLCILESL